jgi:hypothetical protein
MPRLPNCIYKSDLTSAEYALLPDQAFHLKAIWRARINNCFAL